jgi:Fic family protein
VQPDLVRGTLRKGFELILASPLPESRAALAKFVVSEIHPFADGNGRVSRLFMNLILSEAGLIRIVIPTVLREDYILALKALTNDGHAEPYVRMLTRAAQFSSLLDYANQAQVLEQLERSNAKKESHEAKLDLAPLAEKRASRHVARSLFMRIYYAHS